MIEIAQQELVKREVDLANFNAVVRSRYDGDGWVVDFLSQADLVRGIIKSFAVVVSPKGDVLRFWKEYSELAHNIPEGSISKEEVIDLAWQEWYRQGWSAERVMYIDVLFIDDAYQERVSRDAWIAWEKQYTPEEFEKFKQRYDEQPAREGAPNVWLITFMRHHNCMSIAVSTSGEIVDVFKQF